MLIRYMDLKGNATTDGDHALDIKGADGNATVVENVLKWIFQGMHLKYRFRQTEIQDMVIMSKFPFSVVTAEATIPMAVSTGDNGYNNIFVGAQKTSVLVALGSLVGGGAFTNLGDAPYMELLEISSTTTSH